MPQEFQIESFLSDKQLNNQSVSLVIPRLTREKIHNVMYYKINLNTVALRGDTMGHLCRVIVRDLGSLSDQSVNQVNVLGGVEFKCILMKLIEIRPTWDQLSLMLASTKSSNFNNKYIVALILTYLRIQYFFLPKDNPLAKQFGNVFITNMNDYRKMKSVSMNMDCWSASQQTVVHIVHMDELVEWLASKDNIWGIPLGKCQWCRILGDEESSSEDGSENESY